MKKKIYLAAPWFSPKQAAIYNQVVENLRANPNYELMLPRDFVMEDGYAMDNFDWACHVFEHDTMLLDMADIVYGIDWGFESDAGTAWELGYAYAKGVPVVIVRPQEVKLASLMLMGGSIAAVDEKLEYQPMCSVEYK